jgi:MSHA biogenesis protein MshQ
MIPDRSRVCLRAAFTGAAASWTCRCLAVLLLQYPGLSTTQAAISYVNKSTATSASGTGSAGGIRYVDSGEEDSEDNGSIRLKLPESLAANDLVICLVESRDNVTPSVSASGWTRLYSQSTGSASQSSLFYKWAGAGDAGSKITLTHTGGGGIVARCSAFRGVSTTTPFDVADAGASSPADDTVETGAIAGGTSGRLLLFAAHMADDHQRMSITTTGGQTWSRAFFSDDGSGSGSVRGMALGLHYATQAPATAIGPLAGTVDYDEHSGAAVSYGALLALRPGTSSGSTGAGLTIAVPAGTVAGDAMVAAIAVRPYRGSRRAFSIATPAGWSRIRSVQQSSSTASQLALYLRIASAGEPASHSWWFVGSHRGAAGAIASFRGVDPNDPIDAENGAATEATGSGAGTVKSRTHTAPAVTTTSAYAALVASFAYPRAYASNFADTWTPPAAMTEIVDAGIRSGESGESLELAWATQAVPATVRGKAATARADADRGTAHMLALRPYVAPNLDHIRIEHDGNAVTCAREPVTIRACADAGCTTPYTPAVALTLSPAGWWSALTGGSQTNIVGFSGGSAVYYLAKSTSGTVTLDAGGISPAPVNPSPIQCINSGGSPACALNFGSAQLLISPIPTQTAGVASAAISLQAVTGTSGGGTTCTGISGNNTLDLAFQCIDPDSCAGRQLTVNSTAIAANGAGAVTAWTPVTLNFGSNSTASFTLNYPDAGKLMLAARYPSGDGSGAAGPSNPFVVLPFELTIGNIRRSSDGFANPAAATAGGSVFAKAGESFSATVTAVAADGSATPNFGRESVPEGVVLSHSLVAPADGSAGTLGGTRQISGAAFTSGTATVTGLNWDDVGAITLRAGIADGLYLAAGNVTGTSVTIGRFIPHHFSTSATPACPSPTRDPDQYFTYSGQAFADVTVNALDATEDTTQNYDYDLGFAKTVTLSDGGDASRLSGNSFSSEVAAGSALGTATTYTFASPQSAPRQLTLRATDTDSVSSAGHDEATPWMYSGRLYAGNATGSELLQLPVPLLAQYYDGNAWVTNVEDQCSSFGTGDLSLSNYTQNLASGETTPSIANSPLAAGDGGLSFSAPGAGNTGSLELTVTVPDYLRFDWDGDAATPPANPAARIVFTTLTPSGATVIDTRENF